MNKFQTVFSQKYLDNLPQEIQEQYYDCINNVPYIHEFIKDDRLRAKDLPKDKDGKIIVDVTKPHILEDMDYFRPSAIHYQKYGCFTNLKPNANPNSEYGKWIREEVRRCWEGYVRPYDGEWITGDYYFFLNYCPIQLIKKDEKGNTIRTIDFPKVWDGHYLKSHYLLQCRLHGHHAAELASRGKGKAHPLDEKIYTPFGKTTFKHIKVGSIIFGDDGKPTKVIKIPNKGNFPMLELTFENGEKVQCSTGHLWNILEEKEWFTVPASFLNNEYQRNNKKTFLIPISKRIEFNGKFIKYNPYEYGLYLGNNKKKIFKEIKLEITAKRIYKEYLFNTSEIRLDVLRGIIESNGKIIKNGVIEFVLKSKKLIQDIRTLCGSLGIAYSDISVDSIKENYLMHIYTDLFFEDKTFDKEILDRMKYNKIIFIKYIGKKQGKCITVDNDSNLYLIDNFIVTHNSYFGASLLAKRFILGESKSVNKKVQCVATASERKYIQGANQLLDMFQSYIDFCANNTEFPRQRITSSLQNMSWTMGYIDSETNTRRGTENSVIGITSKDDESKLRGSRGVLYLLEESGTFPRLLNLYQVLRPSVEDGNSVWGTIFLYGCCCAGTKVYKENGEPINIEDVSLNDKLLGYNGNENTLEEIVWKQPKGYKECVEIFTEKSGYLKCSIDHPLMILNKNKFGRSLGSCSFYRANELHIGDTLLIPRKRGKFGKIHEKDAFLLGALFGDGNYSNNSCVSLSITTNEEYEYYNKKYSIGISKLYTDKTLYAQIYFRNIHPLLQKYGMDKQSFENKKLPNNIFDWDKESVCLFLAGYFNADGNVQIIKKKHRSIKLTCKYENILEQIKCLLYKLGISSHIYKEQKPKRILHSNVNNVDYKMNVSKVYVLYISNSMDINIFKNNIKLLIKEKQKRLDSYNLCFSKGIADNIKFILRENGKGELLKDKIFNDLKCVTIKSIKNIGKQVIYNMTANTTHTYISNGFISSNTSGDSDSDFSSMQELMYNPKGYNIESLENIYDKEGQGRKVFAFFFPGYLNRADCYDDNGNSDVTKALMEILQDRYQVKYNSTDINAITKRISEIPITPQEAILKSKGNIFPIADLTKRLNEIDNNPNFYDDTYIGDLVFDKSGTVSFEISNKTPIHEFPTKDNKIEGAIEIFEMPKKINEKIPNERYILSLDNYENDSAESMSLGSILVLDLWTDRIVAEYTGRPQFVDELNEICRKMCMFYNGKVMVENNKKNTFAYFSKMNSLHLMADTPEYLKNKQILKATTFGNSSKGCPATIPVINFAMERIKDWLLKPVTTTEEVNGEPISVTVPNLYFIKNRALIKELMLYNPAINVDRIMSLCQLMLYREEKMILYQGNPERVKDKTPNDYLGNDPYFNENYNKIN